MLRFLEQRPVSLTGISDPATEGVAFVQRWSSREAFRRGGKRALKVVGAVLAVLLPFAFLEPFLFMVWGSLALGILLLVVGPVLHLGYWNERESFEHVEGECPNCHARGKLAPYMSTAFVDGFTVLCPACGQTARVFPKADPSNQGLTSLT